MRAGPAFRYPPGMKANTTGRRPTRFKAAFAAFLIAGAAAGARLHAQETSYGRPAGETTAAAFVTAALAKDGGVASKKASLQAALASLKAVQASGAAGFSLGAGLSRLALDGSSWSASSSMTVDLEEELGTELAASITLAPQAEGAPSLASGTLRLSQPLSSLASKSASTALLKAEAAALEARWALDAAKAELEASVLGLLRDWAAAENALAAARYDLAAARRNLASAKALGQYGAGSTAMARLESAAYAAELSLRKAEMKVERARASVASLTGLDADLPELAGGAPAAPDAPPTATGASITALKALSALRLKEAEYLADWGQPLAGVSLVAEWSKASGTENAWAGAEWKTDGLSLSLGAGWNIAGGTPYAEASLSWSPNARAASGWEKSAASALLDASRRAYAAALEAEAADKQDISLERSLYPLEESRLAALYATAALAAEEAAALQKSGYGTAAATDEAVQDAYAAYAALENQLWSMAISEARLRASWTE